MAVENSQARTTPPVPVSFPFVLKKRSYQDGVPSFSIRLMFDKMDKEHMMFLRTLKSDCDDVMARQWADESKRPRIPAVGHDKSPIKDGDKACNAQGIPFSEKYPELEGHFFFNCSQYGDTLPVVDRDKSEILEASKIYSGCICKVNINVYARARKDNPGVSIGLNGVQKWADGERIGGGGGPSVDDMFEAASSEDTSNYEDPLGLGVQDDDLPF